MEESDAGWKELINAIFYDSMRLAAADFHHGPGTSDLAPDELPAAFRPACGRDIHQEISIRLALFIFQLFNLARYLKILAASSSSTVFKATPTLHQNIVADSGIGDTGEVDVTDGSAKLTLPVRKSGSSPEILIIFPERRGTYHVSNL